MRPRPPAPGRRSFLVGSGALLATGCEFTYPPQPREEDMRTIDAESLMSGGDQSYCAPVAETPVDLAWAPRLMRVPEAWKYSSDSGRPPHGNDIVIGHVDTGVADHLELRPATPAEPSPILWDRGYDFVDDLPGGYDPLVNTWHLEQIGHGTATASVMVSRGGIVEWPTYGATCGGTTAPGRITGVAPAAYVLPVRAFRFAASGERRRVARAIDYLVDQKVDVITMALGWPDPSDELEGSIIRAVKANILVLAASGNWVDRIVYPARAGNAIGIGGVGPSGKTWRFSSKGREVVVSAPGDKVWRAYRNDKTNRLDLIGPRFGTSFSVSLTAGVAALWLAYHGREQLKTIAHDSDCTVQALFRKAVARSAYKPPGWNAPEHTFGAGVVNAEDLLKIDEKDLRKLALES